jgi:hypothetical protein
MLTRHLSFDLASVKFGIISTNIAVVAITLPWEKNVVNLAVSSYSLSRLPSTLPFGRFLAFRGRALQFLVRVVSFLKKEGKPHA